MRIPPDAMQGGPRADAVRAGRRAPASAALAMAPPARRLKGADRERQIVEGAVRFFADRGLDGQLRDLAKNIGVTHALLYHYFPTKQALIDRVYVELFEGLWQPAWDRLLDDRRIDVETKLTRFYRGYAKAIFSREFVRIMVFSGLSDHTIPDRFFALLRERLFPRLIRETRRHRGAVHRGRPSARELELLMGLHGGIFYIGLRRWVYEQPVHGAEASEHDDAYIADRVRSYLLSAGPVLDAPPAADLPGKTPKETATWA
jgi:AcrR family transcriptional regulator